MEQSNRIRLHTLFGGELVSHFSLHEFENREGWCMIHPRLLRGLEALRAALCADRRADTQIIITRATVSEAENRALAARLGWTTAGGLVSPDTRHLSRWGGIAADIVCRDTVTKAIIPPLFVGQRARQLFSFVKDDYADNHVHVDQR